MLPTHFFHNNTFRPIDFNNPHHADLLKLMVQEARDEPIGAGQLMRASELAFGEKEYQHRPTLVRLADGGFERVSRSTMADLVEQMQGSLDDTTQNPPPEVFL